MKKEHLEILFNDLRELLRIEVLLSKNKMTQEDAESLQALAEKGHPRAEFDYGLFLAMEKKDSQGAKEWFDRCRRHASGSFMNKLRRAYVLIGKRKSQKFLDLK